MKNLLVIILLIAVFFTNCDNTDEIDDYRNQFIGKYSCSYALKTISILESKGVYIDTLFYSIDTVINISKSEIDNQIRFLDWELVINRNGLIDSAYCVDFECMECEYFPINLDGSELNFETNCGNIKTTWYTYKIIGVKL